MEPSNQRNRDRSRTLGLAVQFVSGFLLGFTCTVTLTTMPTVSVGVEGGLLQS